VGANNPPVFRYGMYEMYREFTSLIFRERMPCRGDELVAVMAWNPLG
jgi:hypothetical protein